MSDTHLFANGMVGEGRASLSKIVTEGDLNPAAAISPRAFGFGLDMSETGYIEKLPTVSVTGNGGAFNFNATESPWFEGGADEVGKLPAVVVDGPSQREGGIRVPVAAVADPAAAGEHWRQFRAQRRVDAPAVGR